MTKRKIILASRSPARRELLREAGLKIGVAYPDVDESRLKNETVRHYALRIAETKARNVASRYKGGIIIAVDTIITLGNDIFGKPQNRAEAKRTLRKLSGRWHKVYSGTVVFDTVTNTIRKALIISRVKFMRLTNRQIDWYISTGEPLMAAGAYSIQNRGRNLIESVDGCLTNIIGISIPAIMKMLNDA